MSLYTFGFTAHLSNRSSVVYLTTKFMPTVMFRVNNEFAYFCFTLFVVDMILVNTWGCILTSLYF